MDNIIAHIAAAKQLVNTGMQASGTGSGGEKSNSGIIINPDVLDYNDNYSDPIINPDVLDYDDNYSPDSGPIINPDLPEYGLTHNEITNSLIEEKGELTSELQSLLPYSDATPEEKQRIKELAIDLLVKNDEIKTNILQQTAPILILPGGNVNLPADPTDFIAEAQLIKDNGIGENYRWGGSPFGNEDEIIGDNTDANLAPNFTPGELTGLDSDYYLDVNHETITNIGSEDAPVFYQADINGDPPRVSYHVFYPFNDGPYGQNHEGDFETVTVHLNPDTLQPQYISYSAHGEVKSIPYEDAPKDPITGQPQVFVAGGSHANFDAPGSYKTKVPYSIGISTGWGDVTIASDPNLQDHTAMDVNGDGLINSNDGAVVVDTSDQLESATAQEWYPEDGVEGPKYGEQGNFALNDVTPVVGLPGLGSDGPTGLSGDKGHLELNLEGGN